MVKRVAPPDDTGSAIEVSAMLETARRDLGGLGKKARRRFERLERRIATAIKTETKRRGQLDDARAELASLIERVADMVRPARSGEPEATLAEPGAAGAAPSEPSKPAANRPAAGKPAANRPAAGRSLRAATKSTGSPES